MNLSKHLVEHATIGALTAAQVAATLERTVPSAAPRGSESWLNDLYNGFDIYSRGFVKTPTIFFDPRSSATKELGTYNYPYKTAADVIARCAGVMGGQTLGIKRGSTVNLPVTQDGLILTVCGTATADFSIVPYGDASALPIITGLVTVPANRWALYSGSIYGCNIGLMYSSDASIWSNTERDLWQNGVRIIKKTSLAGVTGPGMCYWNNTDTTGGKTAKTIYAWLYASEVPTTQVKTQGPDLALRIVYPNLAAVGYISVAGMDIEGVRNNCLSFATTGVTSSISTADRVSVVGCRGGRVGVDMSGGSGGMDAFVVYGPENTKRLTNLYCAGNYAYDALNNALEVANIGSGVQEYSSSYDCRGNSIIEMWEAVSGMISRYNMGELSAPGLQAYPAGAGNVFWINNRYGGAPDTVHTNNINNQVYFNLGIAPQKNGIQLNGGGDGGAHKVYNNTFIFDMDRTGSTSSNAFVSNSTAPAGFCDISNNIFFLMDTGTPTNYFACGQITQTLGASAGVPTGTKNVYLVTQNATLNLYRAGFAYNGGREKSFTTAKAALAA